MLAFVGSHQRHVFLAALFGAGKKTLVEHYGVQSGKGR
jgi:hypothetical protein